MLTAGYFLSCGDRLHGFVVVILFCATTGAFHKAFKFLHIGQQLGNFYLLFYELDGAKHSSCKTAMQIMVLLHTSKFAQQRKTW